MRSFADFKLLPSLHTTLAAKGLITPTEVQMLVIPPIIAGRSMVGIAQTGTGKTLAYVLPMLHKLKSLENEGQRVAQSSSPRAAVIVPTRELGEQVARVFKEFTHDTRLRVRSVLGGTTLEVAKKNLQGCFEILVATPGRLLQLKDRNLVNLADVRLLVFDEADQMLDPGFLADAKRIALACSLEPQMGLFSATVSPAVQSLIQELFASAEIIRTQKSTRLAPALKVRKRFIKDGKRFPFLQEELGRFATGGTLIFVNTRTQCDEVAQQLKESGLQCAIYRGEMDKVQRRANLKAFRERKIDLLVSTDLASRGLDVDHVARVINYHLPRTLENYIHRVGRTARAGRAGLVVNLVTERDLRLMEAVDRIAPELARSPSAAKI
jgi:ATP-dependent RNA helicase RhlE